MKTKPNMKTMLDKNSILDRFAKRSWAVRLSVNGWPVNYTGLESVAVVVKYSPDREESPRRALRRFVGCVERAATGSLYEPSVLTLGFVELYHDSIIEKLISLLRGRWALSATRSRFIVDLGLDLLDPATPGAVDRIIGS